MYLRKITFDVKIKRIEYSLYEIEFLQKRGLKQILKNLPFFQQSRTLHMYVYIYS